MARRRLPGPIFNYIDGAADDEMTYRRNTATFERCDLVPNVLRGVSDDRPVGDRDGPEAGAAGVLLADRAAAPVPSRRRAGGRRGGVGIRHDVRRVLARHRGARGSAQGLSTPQSYQFYFHKDRGLNRAMLQRAKQAGVDVMMLTVDTITGGNRERDLRTGFSIPLRLDARGHAAVRDQADVGPQLPHARALPVAAARRAHRPGRRFDLDRPLFHRDARSVDELGRRRRHGEASGAASSASRA